MNAALKAKALAYPTVRAIASAVSSVPRNRSAATVMRQSARYDMGGVPTNSVKRRANAARDTPVREVSAGGQCGDRPRCTRIVVDQPERLAHHRITLRTEPAGSVGALPAQPRPHGLDEGEVEQPVEDGLLPGPRFVELGDQQVEHRGGDVGDPHQRHRRQRGQQPGTDVTGDAVGAGDEH